MERLPSQAAEQSSRIQQMREFPFSDREFERARRLIHKLAGIAMSELKQDMVYGRLVRCLRAKGLKSFEQYLDLVEADRGREREAFINALTTNLTSFFREPHHFPMLAEHARGRAGAGPYRVWCAASSTGEEPYSIAIALAEALPAARAMEIVASDVDTQVLEAAQRGVYPEARVRGIAPERLRRFFQPAGGAGHGMLQVRPELSSRIDFKRINLLDADWGLRGQFDAIFCRNVMIYFDKPTQRRLVERFRPLLRPEGLLICGHSESLQNHADLFRSLGRTAYAPVSRPA
ncbi:CheR family methyltransferase [Thauera linaloolentis]|uniref:Chemotaxis protein methyltransferase n=1 Tax=Thauera linaloolentis (strain DSM 12138 / JCM 21573 / CCUG 41526 / CIP 105981 / IAM 15112 / NBRC 102519 / 47Lol) TaxID=1123367 RepID=N6XTI3_THAL4|nr:CheR family methyltransferase [Thauera linaloolentis]ENO85051.1 chemotaxis protein CheR [Thauera linaloolentis 47Lol = DSM 12138]MCM8567259.1 chemotaxis protein CheR [Thauera linaloolentis]